MRRHPVVLQRITKGKLAPRGVQAEDGERSKPRVTPTIVRREFPVPSLTVFFVLQALDVLTTLIGLSAGASEASIFVGRLMQLGPLEMDTPFKSHDSAMPSPSVPSIEIFSVCGNRRAPGLGPFNRSCGIRAFKASQRSRCKCNV